MQSQTLGSLDVKEADYKLRKDRLFEGINRILPPLSSSYDNDNGVLKDIQYTHISEWCDSNDFYQWGRTPQTLVILHIIGCPDAIEEFVRQGLSDISLPYSEENLPRAIKGSKRAEFIAHQRKVLSVQALDLERSGSTHCSIDGNADLYFHLHRELGSGGFGTVDHVFSRLSLKPYARKRLPRGRSFKRDQDAIRVFENELKALKALSHRHLVRLIGSYTDRKFVGLLMIPVADMDLQAYFTAPSVNIPDRPIRLRQFFGCLATAVEYLHKQKIRHKDIKPQNILIKDGQVLLTDFGTSRCWADKTGDTTIGTNRQAFTKAYCAPEVANHETRSVSADIWSLGCVFLEMCTVLANSTVPEMRQFFQSSGTQGMYIRDNPEAANLWMRHLREISPNNSDHQVLDLVPDMCDLARDNRPTATEIVSLIIDFEGPMYYGFCCDRDEGHANTGNPDTITTLNLTTRTWTAEAHHEATPRPNTAVAQSAYLAQSELTLRRLDTRSGSDLGLPSRSKPQEQVESRSDHTKIARKPWPSDESSNSHPTIETTSIQVQKDVERETVLSQWFKDFETELEAAKTTRGMKPLHFAAEQRRLEIVQYLVEKGADIEAKDQYQWTPLHRAAHHGHLGVVQYLVEKGADMNALNKSGKDSEALAREENHDVLADWLDEEMIKKQKAHTISPRKGVLVDELQRKDIPMSQRASWREMFFGRRKR